MKTYLMKGIPDGFWKDVRIHAAKNDVNIKELILQLLRKAIYGNSKKGSK